AGPVTRDVQCNGRFSHCLLIVEVSSFEFEPETRNPRPATLLIAQYFLSSGCQWVMVTGRYSILGPSGVRKARLCLRKFASSRFGKSVRVWEPRDSFRLSAEFATASATSSM